MLSNGFKKFSMAFSFFRYRDPAVAPASARTGRSSRRPRIPHNFTYISACVKYTMFLFNFLFWMCGLLLVAVIYIICFSPSYHHRDRAHSLRWSTIPIGYYDKNIVFGSFPIWEIPPNILFIYIVTCILHGQ